MTGKESSVYRNTQWRSALAFHLTFTALTLRTAYDENRSTPVPVATRGAGDSSRTTNLSGETVALGMKKGSRLRRQGTTGEDDEA